MTVLDKLESIAKIIGVAAACIGIWHYYADIQQGKIDKSVAYFDEYHKGPVFAARAELGAASIQWLEYIGAEKPSVEDVAKRIIRDLRGPDLRLHADILVEFYDRLAACAALGACDADTAKRLFSGEAKEAETQLTMLVAHVRRSGDPNYASGLLCFSGSQACDL